MREASRDLVDVMGDEHEWGTGGVERELAETRDEVFARAEIESCGRLVEQQQLGIGHERARELHALLLAARECPEHPPREARDPEAVEQLDRAGAVRLGVGVPPGLERGVAGRHHDVDDLDLAAQHRGHRRARKADSRPQPAHVDASQLAAEHRHGAARRVQVQRRDADERRLSRTVRSEHHPTLAGADPPVDAIQDAPPVVDERYAAQLERGRGLLFRHGAAMGSSSRCGRPLASAAPTASPTSPAFSTSVASTPIERANPT